MFKKGLMKKGDIIVIIFLITISFSPYFIFFHNKQLNSKSLDDVKYAVVKIDGKEIERINLDTPKEFIKTYYLSKGQYNTIEVKNGHVRVKKDNSPDQIAVKTGWISEPGQTSICIPHRFILEIVQQYSKDYYIY
ncbi:NusG domain II-containing protein [Enterococcus faecalis]|nr:NusG domain II-containing protein [Enterococcus faecalis]